MSFIVAPTTGFNSFADTTYADGVHNDRNNDAWTDALTTAKQAALIRATDYIQYNYRFSTPAITTDTDGVTLVVNDLVKLATAMLALEALTLDLQPTNDGTITTGTSQSLAGVGSLSNQYSISRADRFPKVTSILSSIASRSGGVVVGTMVR